MKKSHKPARESKLNRRPSHLYIGLVIDPKCVAWNYQNMVSREWLVVGSWLTPHFKRKMHISIVFHIMYNTQTNING